VPESSTEYVGGRDELELKLIQAWERVFGLTPIGIDHDFFDLGGHSILAVRLFAEVQNLTGVSLPMAILFKARTIRGLADVIRNNSWHGGWSSLVAVKPEGSRPPFFGVHGVGGNILEFYPLAGYFDHDQPLFALQAQGLDGKSPWHSTVEEMAAHYVKEIKEFQKTGPYYLGGSSFGGLVAYEMACLLAEEGDGVGMVALFDTNGPGYPKDLAAVTAVRKRWNHLRFRMDLHWSNFVVAGRGNRVAYLRTKADRLSQSMRKKLKRRYKKFKRNVKMYFMPRAIREVRKAGIRADEAYVPRPYPGKVTLFRATEQPYGIHPDRTNGWSGLALGGIEVIDIPGHHGAIMREPRVHILAAHLMHCLKEAQALRDWHVQARGATPTAGFFAGTFFSALDSLFTLTASL
jgi:thioesterase domain-containing protein/acyl carrier protein